MATSKDFLLIYEIKDNIINKPLKNYIVLKWTINYNYLRHTIYSNMHVLFKAQGRKLSTAMAASALQLAEVSLKI